MGSWFRRCGGLPGDIGAVRPAITVTGSQPRVSLSAARRGWATSAASATSQVSSCPGDATGHRPSGGASSAGSGRRGIQCALQPLGQARPPRLRTPDRKGVGPAEQDVASSRAPERRPSTSLPMAIAYFDDRDVRYTADSWMSVPSSRLLRNRKYTRDTRIAPKRSSHLAG